MCTGELTKKVNSPYRPYLNPLINKIRKIRADVGFDNWDAVRNQRNYLAHKYPVLNRGWRAVKHGVGPVGQRAQALIKNDIPQLAARLPTQSKFPRYTLISAVSNPVKELEANKSDPETSEWTTGPGWH
jgi:hypothetical protein